MALETADTIWGLNAANPPGTDPRPQGDNHIRLIKAALQGTLLRGAIGDRPAASIQDRLYIATDEKKIYRDTGSEWELLGSTLSDLLGGEIINGDDTLVAADGGHIKFVDTSAADVTITLPPEATAGIGWWVILIKTDAANSMIVRDDAAALLGTYDPDGSAVIVTTDAVSWFLLLFSLEAEYTATHASVYLASGHALTNGSYTKVVFDTVVYDPGSRMSAGAYTVDEGGKLLVCAHINVAGDPEKLAIFVDGTIRKQLMDLDTGLGATNVSVSGSAIIDVAANEVVDIRVLPSGSSNVSSGQSLAWAQFARLLSA